MLYQWIDVVCDTWTEHQCDDLWIGLLEERVRLTAEQYEAIYGLIKVRQMMLHGSHTYARIQGTRVMQTAGVDEQVRFNTLL